MKATTAGAPKSIRALQRWPRPILVLVAAVVAAGPAPALPKEEVAISAMAAPAAVRPVGADGRAVAQTYTFMRGHYFGGQWRLKGLESVTFEELLPALATGLAQQNYLPARSAAGADLVVVVHWGVTDIYEDPVAAEDRIAELNQRLGQVTAAGRSGALPDVGGLNETLRDMENSTISQRRAIERNAALLGYATSLVRERRRAQSSTDEERMNVDLNESRYFVVLMAYERLPAATDRKPGLLWVTRVSVRALGTNFLEAFPVLVHAGGQVFGRNLDGLVRVQPKAAVPGVELGELKVLEMDPKSRPADGTESRQP